MKLNRRLMAFALVFGVLALATAFLVSNSTALADEAELVVADVAAEFQLADEDPPPRDPAPRECVQACKTRAQQWIRQCVADGGIRERCQKQGEQKAQTCIERCPPEARDPKPVPREPEPRKPDPKKCVGECERLAREYYGKCLRRTGGEKPAECKRKANRFLKACIDRKCPRKVEKPDPGRVAPKPEPAPAPSPEQCVEKCAKTAQEFLRKCKAGQLGRVAPVDCEKKAREMHRVCLEKCPKADPQPEPEPDACVKRCKQLGQRALRECLGTGAAPERCEQRSNLAVRQCVADNCP